MLCFQEHPDLIKDQFWDDLYPEIPYTAAAEEKRGPDPVIGAAANIEVKYLAHIVSGMILLILMKAILKELIMLGVR